MNRNEVLQNEVDDITNKYSEFDNELQKKCQEENELNAKLNDLLQQLKHKEGYSILMILLRYNIFH